MHFEIIKKENFVVHDWSGGTTSEIFLFPPSSSWKDKDFQLRISSANCQVDGAPYTDFTGFTRHIMPLSGTMHMFHEGHHEVMLRPYEVDVFDGAWSTHHQGIAVDFNLLCSDQWSGRIEPVRSAETLALQPSGIAGFYAVVDTDISFDRQNIHVAAGDFAVFQEIAEPIEFRFNATASGPCVIAACAYPQETALIKLSQKPTDQFCALTASEAPAPGGGSVSALCGALAASLAEMVGNLTIGRKGYEDTQDEIKKAAAELEKLRNALLEAIDEDAESFNAFMAALKMPKNSDEEKMRRKAAMDQALKNASLVPLQVARESVKIFSFSRLMLKHGNRNAATDAIVSALAARTAVLGALFNVRINLRSVKDPKFAQETLAEVLQLEAFANEQEKQITELGYQLLNQ